MKAREKTIRERARVRKALLEKIAKRKRVKSGVVPDAISVEPIDVDPTSTEAQPDPVTEQTDDYGDDYDGGQVRI